MPQNVYCVHVDEKATVELQISGAVTELLSKCFSGFQDGARGLMVGFPGSRLT